MLARVGLRNIDLEIVSATCMLCVFSGQLANVRVMHVNIHESSVGLFSTTNPKPRGNLPTAQANLCQSGKRQSHLGA